MHDLKYFIFILAIFIIGYGVAFQAVRFPNSNIGKAIVGVINKPYWQMYGELFIEEILGIFLFVVKSNTVKPVCKVHLS